MKVLMLGWEFPPVISGGLGVACYGITKGLAQNDVYVKFVIPAKRQSQVEENIELIAAFEAILYDIPIIISKQSGVKEILKGAVTIDFWDVNKLADIIITLLEDKEFANCIVERCRDDMKYIGWNITGKKIKSIYQSLISM